MAHMLAKQIVADEQKVRVPRLEVTVPDFDSLIVEDQMAELRDVLIEPWSRGLRPDATATWDDIKVAIEIFVTNECDDAKITKYREQNLPAIEIDLSSFRDGLEPSRFKFAVLHGARRRWLYHPYMNEPARRVERKLLQHNAEIAKSHADARCDPVGQSLVEEWFRHFWASA